MTKMKLTRIFSFIPVLLILLGLVIGILEGFQDPMVYYMIGIGFFGLLYVQTSRSRAKFEKRYLNKDKEEKD